MTRSSFAVLLAACIVGCESKKTPGAPKEPLVQAPAAPQSDPGGTNFCSKCNVTLRDTRCRYCGTELKREAPRLQNSTPKLFVCPKDGCAYYSTSREKCLAHPDTDLVAEWFVCSACGTREVEAGTCSRCRKELRRELVAE